MHSWWRFVVFCVKSRVEIPFKAIAALRAYHAKNNKKIWSIRFPARQILISHPHIERFRCRWAVRIRQLKQKETDSAKGIAKIVWENFTGQVLVLYSCVLYRALMKARMSRSNRIVCRLDNFPHTILRLRKCLENASFQTGEFIDPSQNFLFPPLQLLRFQKTASSHNSNWTDERETFSTWQLQIWLFPPP